MIVPLRINCDVNFVFSNQGQFVYVYMCICVCEIEKPNVSDYVCVRKCTVIVCVACLGHVFHTSIPTSVSLLLHV